MTSRLGWMAGMVVGCAVASGLAAGQAVPGRPAVPGRQAVPGRPAVPASPAIPMGPASPAGGRLVGPWAIHGSVSGVDWDQKCHFVQKDETLSGTCRTTTDTKEQPITGTFDGKKVQWVQPGEYEGGPITITFTGTLSDPAKMGGSVAVDPMNATGDFTGAPAVEGGT